MVLIATDTSHVPCKFFRQGACQAGNACPFSHDLGAAAETVCKYFAKVRDRNPRTPSSMDRALAAMMSTSRYGAAPKAAGCSRGVVLTCCVTVG